MNGRRYIGSGEEAFKYQSLPISIAMFSLFICLSVFFAIRIFDQYGYREAFLFSVIVVPVLTGLALLTTFDRSDVVVGADGISRKLFGWTWRSVLWRDIELIRVLDSPVLTAQKKRAFVKIIPSRPQSGGKVHNLVIGKDLDMAGRFITVMNLHIANFQIPVETVLNGISNKTDHL